MQDEGIQSSLILYSNAAKYFLRGYSDKLRTLDDCTVSHVDLDELPPALFEQLVELSHRAFRGVYRNKHLRME